MNTFKRIVIALPLVTGAVLMAAPAQAAYHVPFSACASSQTYMHLNSHRAHRCERQGFLYSVSLAPVGNEEILDVLVVGPAGHVYVDTFGQTGATR